MTESAGSSPERGWQRKTIVTIDGPAASGKSTVARLVASRLAVPFVSSGLLYRAAAHVAITAGCHMGDQQCLLDNLIRRAVTLVPDMAGNRLLLDDADLTDELHTDEVDAAVSTVASHPGVRDWVNARLREMEPPFVVEGRDMGTVVFPEAQHKFFLTAPVAVRARRRLGERTADLETVSAALIRRDEQDSLRLDRAPDAVPIDTGELTADQVVAEVLRSLGRGDG